MQWKTRRTLTLVFSLAVFFCIIKDATAQFYQNSYAVVIGINKYRSSKFNPLTYARKDAEGIATFLKSQGFKVATLYDEKATKVAIISMMQNELAPRVKSGDRILVFFAGHGFTETLGDNDWGYIVPYDGGDKSASYLAMDELRVLSEKMGTAKHQLFIMDCCFGGLLGTRDSVLDPKIPNYLREISKRTARQVLTAGGRDQEVRDGGRGGHSVFTAGLLEALKMGLADTNGDGFITFSELCSYVVPRASNSDQTPACGTLPGHGLGEFVFLPNAGNPIKKDEPISDSSSRSKKKKKNIQKILTWGGASVLVGATVYSLWPDPSPVHLLNGEKLPDPPGGPTGN